MPAHEDAPAAGFAAFFERHHQDLTRLAYLLTGDRDVAHDLASDTFLAVWHQWSRVVTRDQPLSYVRRIMVNQASTRIRRLTMERRSMPKLCADAREVTELPDGAAVVDVRAALALLPTGRRNCVVLRFAFDLSERETAEVLGVTVGTVKSQTSRALADLQRLLGPGDGPSVGALAGRVRQDRSA